MDNSGTTVSAAAIIRKGWRLVAVTPAESIAYVVVTAATGMLSDIDGWERVGIFASSIASLALGYVLVVSMLMKGDLLRGSKNAGFGSYFGLGILSTFGITLGAILLILPGLVLWLRWSAAYGFLFDEEGGVIASLGKSWRATAPHFWHIALAMLTPLALLVGAIMFFVFTISDEAVPIGASAAINMSTSLGGLAATAVGLAVYTLIAREDRGISQVFA